MGLLSVVRSDMSPTTVTVYRVRIYAPTIDEYLISQRYATRLGADLMKGTIIEGSEVNISVEDLERGEQWTAKGYVPPV
jgi:hypothetical protein